MVSILLSWIVVAVVSYILGKSMISLIVKNQNARLCSTDVYLTTGLMGLTVYAQVFSIFYKVGKLSWIILVIICLLALAYLRYVKKEKQEMRKLTPRCGAKDIVKYSFFILTIIASARWTNGHASFIDTSLYHAQAIRWIEEYGVVPGLGNLQHRFAYNSSFLVLQALFSFKWLIGTSLHTMNGFIVCFLACYNLVTLGIWKGRRISIADMLKVTSFIYIYMNRARFIVSPMTDTMAVLLVFYIFSKWFEFKEQNAEIEDFAFLCVIGVWIVTLKVSVAMIVLLAIHPIVQFVDKKDYVNIGKYLGMGFFAALPWLVRNIIISGYLVYPFAAIDLFQFDWKMPSSVAIWDAKEIKVWGRGYKDVALSDLPVWEWAGDWFLTCSTFYRFLIVVGFIATLLCLVFAIVYLKKKEYCEFSAYLSCVAIITMWFMGAPLLRYGSAFLWMNIAFAAGKVWNMCNIKGDCIVNFIATICIMSMAVSYISAIDDIDYDLVMQPGYIEWEYEDKEKQGYTFYIPTEDCSIGYEMFPSTPYIDYFNKIELRGDFLEDGFRVQEQYKDLRITTHGTEW